MIERIKQNSERILRSLSSEYVKARPEDREAIMAGIQIEREIIEDCQWLSGSESQSHS